MLSIRVGAINREKQWLVAAVVWVLHLSKDEEGSVSIAKAGRVNVEEQSCAKRSGLSIFEEHKVRVMAE